MHSKPLPIFRLLALGALAALATAGSTGRAHADDRPARLESTLTNLADEQRASRLVYGFTAAGAGLVLVPLGLTTRNQTKSGIAVAGAGGGLVIGGLIYALFIPDAARELVDGLRADQAEDSASRPPRRAGQTRPRRRAPDASPRAYSSASSGSVRQPSVPSGSCAPKAVT